MPEKDPNVIVIGINAWSEDLIKKAVSSRILRHRRLRIGPNSYRVLRTFAFKDGSVLVERVQGSFALPKIGNFAFLALYREDQSLPLEKSARSIKEMNEEIGKLKWTYVP